MVTVAYGQERTSVTFVVLCEEGTSTKLPTTDHRDIVTHFGSRSWLPSILTRKRPNPRR